MLGALAGGYAYAHYFVPIIVPAAALIALALPDRPAVPIAVAALGRARAAGDRTARWRRARTAATWRCGRRRAGRAAIRERARPGDTMFVAGSEAGFYWQARVEPASRLLYDSILAFRPELGARPVRAAAALPRAAGRHIPRRTRRASQDAGYTPLEAPPPVVALVR